MQKSRKKALMGGISLGLAALLAIGGSLAYFTDREAVTANGTAGSLNITVDNKIDLSTTESGGSMDDGTYWTNTYNILNPGDSKPVGWVVYEKANKSADIRTRLTLTSDKALTEEDGQAEFEIYNRDDVEEKTDKDGKSLGYAPKTGAKPLQAREISDDKKMITYTPAEYSLNGDTMSGSDAEIDFTDAGSSKESSYVLLCRQDTSNVYQGANISLNVLLEAKQHRNTKDKWGEIANETYTINGKEFNVVPDDTNEPPQGRIYYFSGLSSLRPGDSVTLTNANAKDYNTFTLRNYNYGYCNVTQPLRPGTYTGTYTMVDDLDQSTGKTATLTVDIKDGVTDYDLSDQAKLPDTFTDDNGNTVNIRNLTINLKENPEGKVRVGKMRGYFRNVSGDNVEDPSVLTRTLRVMANEAGSPLTIGVLTNGTTEFPYKYNGDDQWQQVDLSSGDATVNFTGTFTKLPTGTITAPSSFAGKSCFIGYFSNGMHQTTMNAWFYDRGSGALTCDLVGEYGTYKLVDTDDNKMYEFTFDADHTNIDLSTITPVDTALTLNNVDSIPSGAKVSLIIMADDGSPVGHFSLDELQTTSSQMKARTTLDLSCYYNYQTGKLKDGYTAEIDYTTSDGTTTKKSVDLANRTIDFAQ